MSSRLQHAEIGAWVFECVPKTRDIDAALDGGKPIDGWRVHDTYRIDLIEPGQVAPPR